MPALESVLGGQLGDSVQDFNFKTITDRFSELMFEYPFRVPARFALIIRAVVSQEGLALRLEPEFSIIRVAYPYVAKRLLAADTEELRHKLLDVLFDRQGRLQLERLENLLENLLTNTLVLCLMVHFLDVSWKWMALQTQDCTALKVLGLQKKTVTILTWYSKLVVVLLIASLLYAWISLLMVTT